MGARGGYASSASSVSSLSDSESSDSDDSDVPVRKVLGGGKKGLSKGVDQKGGKSGKKVLSRRKNRLVKRPRFGEPSAGASGADARKEAADAYDSGDARSADSDDARFIDHEGEDGDIAREYRASQHFDDEAPAHSKRRQRGNDEGTRGKKKAKYAGALDDDAKRSVVRAVLKAMRDAAAQDYSDRSAGKPAVAKLKLLSQVHAAIANTQLHEFLLDGTIRGYDTSDGASLTLLAVFREWLRPLPGADIPSLQVREAVYAALSKLPLTLDHLREARLGPLLLALSQHPKETPEHRATLAAMVERFSRQIFHKSASYRGQMENMLSNQAQRGFVAAPVGPAASSADVPEKDAAGDLGDLIAREAGVAWDDEKTGGGAGGDVAAAPRSAADAALSAKAALKAAPRHAKIPMPLVFDYVQRPKPALVSSTVRAAPSAAAVAVKKAMTELKKSSDKGVERAVKVSITGRV